MIGTHSNNCFDVITSACLPSSLACNLRTLSADMKQDCPQTLIKEGDAPTPFPLLREIRSVWQMFGLKMERWGQSIILEIKEALVKSIGPMSVCFSYV